MTDDILDEAEAIVRTAAGDAELLIDIHEVPLRLAADQLQQAGDAAMDALTRLYQAAVAWEPLMAAARQQVADLGLSAAHWPATAPFDTGIGPDGVLILRGRAYAGHSPVELLIRTTAYVLHENVELPAGSRFDLRLHRADGEGI